MSKYVETFKSADGVSETLISVSVPDEQGEITELWFTPEVARNVAFELFDAYLSVT